MLRQYPVAEVGDWLHNPPTSPPQTVRQYAERAGFWDKSRKGPTRGQMVRCVTEAGGIPAEHCLHTRTAADGMIHLEDGCHRWAVARDLGIERVPVRLTPPQEDVFAWQ